MSSGTYVAVKPFPVSCQMIYDQFHPHLRSKMTHINDMHVTVLYSKQVVPEAKKATDPNKKFQGTFRKLRWWAGHDKIGYLVIEIDSHDLHYRHEYWKSLGGTHSFDDYMPHMTLAEGISQAEAQNIMGSYNSDPLGLDLPTAFNREYAEDLKD